MSGRVADKRDGGRPSPGEVGGEDARDVTGECEEPAAPDAVLESTEPAGEADLPPLEAAFWTFPTPLGILLLMNPLFSETFRTPPTNPAVLGSRLGMRLPMRPPRAEEDGRAGPAVPKAWVGMRGAASGFSNRAIRSRSEPDTIRGLGSPAPGDDDRERSLGGVRLDFPDLRYQRLLARFIGCTDILAAMSLRVEYEESGLRVIAGRGGDGS